MEAATIRRMTASQAVRLLVADGADEFVAQCAVDIHVMTKVDLPWNGERWLIFADQPHIPNSGA